MSTDLVLDAAVAAGEDGFGITDAAAALPDGPLQKADAGRSVKKLLADGLIETAGRGRWKVTTAAAGATVQPDPPHAPPVPGPLVDGLPEAPPGAAPPPRVDAAAVPIAKVRSIVSAADANPNLTAEERQQVRQFQAVHGVNDYTLWLPGMFPNVFSAPFAPHHHEFWQWCGSIEPGKPQHPFVGLWNRGGAKSASVEAALVWLAARQVRKYAIYVSGTQNLADEHVGAIGGLLESPLLASTYPALGSREVGKYGESKGWRRNRLRTASGFTVDALGLDVAARGARIDEQRPDIIILDDIDSDNDTPALTEKKIRSVTRKLLPAGSQDVVVIAIQNMIHSSSMFARLARMPSAPEADYLSRRQISGPIPAVYDLEWARVGDHYEITAGRPSWEGMPLDACQHMLDLYGLTAFLVECQHVEADLAGGMFDHLDFTVAQDGTIGGSSLLIDETDVPPLRHTAVWVDPAVSSTDRSDSCALVVDGLGIDRKVYRLWSWERVASPTTAMKTAIRAAIEYGAEVVGVETDQGGDTWQVTYKTALNELMAEDPVLFETAHRLPRYEWKKAGSTQQSKVERAARMLAAYEVGKIRHVRGRVHALEAGLRRFPRYKPYDVVDAAYWSWRWCAEKGGEDVGRRRTKVRAPRGQVAEVSASNI